MTYLKYTKEIMQEAVSNSFTMADVMRYLGLAPNGGNSTHMRNKVKAYEIDTSHFLGRGHNKGKTSSNRKDISEILVVLPEGSLRPKRNQLKRAMLASGLTYQCQCGNIGQWQGQELCLEIDHKDGNWLNNSLDNLRFLCPNCHSQQPTSHKPKNK